MKPFEFELSYVDNVQYKGQKIDFDITITGGEGIETDLEDIYFHSKEFSKDEEVDITDVIIKKYKEIIEKLWN